MTAETIKKLPRYSTYFFRTYLKKTGIQIAENNDFLTNNRKKD